MQQKGLLDQFNTEHFNGRACVLHGDDTKSVTINLPKSGGDHGKLTFEKNMMKFIEDE